MLKNNKAYFNLTISSSVLFIIIIFISLFYSQVINKYKSIDNIYNSLNEFIEIRNEKEELYSIFYENFKNMNKVNNLNNYHINILEQNNEIINEYIDINNNYNFNTIKDIKLDIENENNLLLKVIVKCEETEILNKEINNSTIINIPNINDEILGMNIDLIILYDDKFIDDSIKPKITINYEKLIDENLEIIKDNKSFYFTFTNN